MSQIATPSYNAVIAETIKQALELSSPSTGRQGIAGFCQLKGPTGGGKSSALYRRPDPMTPASLEFIHQQGRQAILVTHRWNILHDLYQNTASQKDSQGQPFKVSILYAQDENLISAVTQKPLAHERSLQKTDLPDPFQAIEEIEQLGGFKDKDAYKRLLHNCRNLKNLSERIEFNKKRSDQFGAELLQHEQQEIQKLCAAIEHALLSCLSKLEKALKYAKKHDGPKHPRTLKATQHYTALRQNKWLRRIFPAIVWRDEKQHLLIMTTHKLFYSFYDGQQKVRMSSGQLNGHIIFIDEFDYQADILQKLLSQSQWVQEPPECIGLLLENGGRVLARLKLSNKPEVLALYAQLKQLLDQLTQDLADKGIDLKRSRALMMPPVHEPGKSSFKNHYLFRSDHFISNQRIQLKQMDHGYEVVHKDEPVAQSIDAGDFLRIMERYLRRLASIIARLSLNESEAYDLAVQLNRLLFDCTNDYRPSYYSAVLPNLSLYSLPHSSFPELEQLMKTNLLPNTQVNLKGLAAWLLMSDVTGSTDIDSFRIKIKRAMLPTTAEGLLLALCSQNLVFGLSASSYIERAIGNFDTRWVNAALRYLAEARNPELEVSFLGDSFGPRAASWFKKPMPYLQSEQDQAMQKSIIQALVKQKKQLRNSTLKTHIHDFETAIQHAELNELIQHLDCNFFDVRNSHDLRYGYRTSMLKKLLYSLKLASTDPLHKGHLVFVNSLKYLRKWLNLSLAQRSRQSLSWLQQDDLCDLDPRINTALSAMRQDFIALRVQNVPMIICLLNAEAQKRPGFERAYQAAFDSDRIVVVLTQTASASNGINLDYRLPNSSDKMDLSSIYIIESRHYYFSACSNDEIGEEMAHAGTQLRDLEKLVRHAVFSRKQQKQAILPIMENAQFGFNNAKTFKNLNSLSMLNNAYKQTDDYIKNVAADVQQQVGRIERAWCSVPHVAIHLCQEIAANLTTFAYFPICANNRAWISGLNNQLLDDLIQHHQSRPDHQAHKFMTQQQRGDLAIQIIDQQLIPAIRSVREGKQALEPISRLWDQLGRAVLAHDFMWCPEQPLFGMHRPLKDWACFKLPESSGREIWYDPNSWQFFSQRAPGLIQYQPQALYDVVRCNAVINDWFNQRQFRTSHEPYANELETCYAFHPVVVQRLLQGRIGEQAIIALIENQQIKTQQKITQPQLFERYDFEIKNSCYVVDAKYWSSATMDKADDDYQLWLASDRKAEHAPLQLIHKIKQIQSIRGADTVLVIANLLTDAQDCRLAGFSSDLCPSAVEDAAILFLSGCLSTAQDYAVSSGFKQLIQLFEQASTLNFTQQERHA